MRTWASGGSLAAYPGVHVSLLGKSEARRRLEVAEWIVRMVGMVGIYTMSKNQLGWLWTVGHAKLGRALCADTPFQTEEFLSTKSQ